MADPRYAAWMGLALDLAAAAGRDGDVPVGAVVLSPSGEVVGEGRNRREVDGDPTAHAEIVALRAAAQALGEWRLEDCTLVVTLAQPSAPFLANLPRLREVNLDSLPGVTLEGTRVFPGRVRVRYTT